MSDPRVVLELPNKRNADRFYSPWGPIGGPPQMRHGELVDADPVILITPDIVGLCLQPGGSAWRGTVSSIDHAGVLTIITPERVLIYELFPAVWEDGEGPELYVGRWPD